MHELQGQTKWKVHGSFGLKVVKKCDQKKDFNCFLMVTMESERSSGGSAFHKLGNLLKK